MDSYGESSIRLWWAVLLFIMLNPICSVECYALLDRIYNEHTHCCVSNGWRFS